MSVILVIDNYDSFTYNLVQYLQMSGEEVVVARHDEISVTGIEKLQPDSLLISPGPGTPEGAGVSLRVISRFAGEIPILGICLGHQAIGAAFGAEVVPASAPMHGKISQCFHDGRTMFAHLPSPFRITRYHSLVVRRESLPSCLEVSAIAETGEIMGLRHREYLVEGVQFHPEAILTEYGLELLRNFLTRAQAVRKREREVSWSG